jgi:hypothetical protein
MKEARRLNKAIEGQDTEGTATVADQADKVVKANGATEEETEAGTELKVEAGSSFKSRIVLHHTFIVTENRSLSIQWDTHHP